MMMCKVQSRKRHTPMRGRSTRCRARLAACLLPENHHFLHTSRTHAYYCLMISYSVCFIRDSETSNHTYIFRCIFNPEDVVSLLHNKTF